MADHLTAADLTERAAKVMSTQEYAGGPKVLGVLVQDLAVFPGDDGYFFEAMRLKDGHAELFPELLVKQVSYSQVAPGAIKAFHFHFNQDEVWLTPPDEKLLVVLHDIRKDSKSEGTTMRFVLGGGRARAVYIPRGVAHGVANVGTEPGTVIYFLNQQFSATEPDERRLPWDYLGTEIWQMTRG